MSESVRHKWRHGYSLVHSLFSSLKRKCANFKRFVTHVISIPVHSFYLHHSSHNISFKNREQKVRFMEYSPEILGDFTEEANVMVCTRHFTDEKETGTS